MNSINGNQNRNKVNHNIKIIGIDFGSAFSGYSYTLINDISKIVKNKLDETFTTHPLHKIKNYFNKIKEELNINIDEYKEPSNFIKTEYLITDYFDDIQLDITHKTNNLFTSEEKEKINNKLQLIGYKLT